MITLILLIVDAFNDLRGHGFCPGALLFKVTVLVHEECNISRGFVDKYNL